MKKNRFIVGIASLVLVFGLIITGCPTDSDDGGGNMSIKLEGTWVNSGENEGVSWELIYKFTGNQVEYSDHDSNRWSAIFTFTDTEITFIPASGNSWKQSYSLSEDTLTITRDGQHSYGIFKK
jgi:hypothetical protein